MALGPNVLSEICAICKKRRKNNPLTGKVAGLGCGTYTPLASQFVDHKVATLRLGGRNLHAVGSTCEVKGVKRMCNVKVNVM